MLGWSGWDGPSPCNCSLGYVSIQCKDPWSPSQDWTQGRDGEFPPDPFQVCSGREWDGGGGSITLASFCVSLFFSI